MKFINSEFSTTLNHSKLSLSFGDFYLFDRFFISEMHEGIHFDPEKLEDLIIHLVEFYGEDIKLGYISNRVNSFSVDPKIWTEIKNNYDFIVASAIVSYSNASLIHANLEKRLSIKSLKRCTSLEEAIKWIKNLKEFNQN